MENLGFLLKVGLEQDFVGFFLGFTENDGPTMSASVEVDNVGDDGVAVVEGAVEGEM